MRNITRHLISHAAAFICGVLAAGIPVMLAGYGFFSALAHEAGARQQSARNAMLHQIARLPHAPQQCLAVHGRAACVVRRAGQAHLVFVEERP